MCVQPSDLVDARNVEQVIRHLNALKRHFEGRDAPRAKPAAANTTKPLPPPPRVAPPPPPVEAAPAASATSAADAAAPAPAPAPAPEESQPRRIPEEVPAQEIRYGFACGRHLSSLLTLLQAN